MNITLLIVLALLSLMPNLSKYPFKGEESLRTIVAFEMWYSKSYFQPTFLGEPYFNKPPLFNWLIIAYSHTFPWSEITGRAVSLTFLFLTTLAVGLFSYNLFKKVNLSLLSSLIFLTFGNVLFFYGYLAEIDITFTFFVFGGMISLYLWQRGAFSWAILSGIIFGLSALLKGLPAYAFLTFSLFAFAIYNWNLKALLNKGTALIYLISLVIPLLWLLQTPEPLEYLKNLWRESFSRVEGDFSRLKHMLIYPLINFKDLLPWSLIFFLSLYSLRRELNIPSEIKLLFLLFFINYIPYWISNAAGRYILPLYPILALLFSYYIHQAMKKEAIKRLVLGLLITTIALRFVYGFVFFSYEENRPNSRKGIAKDMATLIDLRKGIARECPEEKSICLYLGIWKGEPLKRLSKNPTADYIISCNKSLGKVIKEYDLKNRKVYLEASSGGLNY